MWNPPAPGAVPPVLCHRRPCRLRGLGRGCSGWSRRLSATLVCSSCRKLEEPWGYSGKHQGRFPSFLEQKTGSELPASMPGRADVELGTEPCKVKDSTDKTTGSRRSDAESGTTEMSDGGAGPGAHGLQEAGLAGKVSSPHRPARPGPRYSTPEPCGSQITAFPTSAKARTSAGKVNSTSWFKRSLPRLFCNAFACPGPSHRSPAMPASQVTHQCRGRRMGPIRSWLKLGCLCIKAVFLSAGRRRWLQRCCGFPGCDAWVPREGWQPGERGPGEGGRWAPSLPSHPAGTWGKLGLLQGGHGEVGVWLGIPLMACVAHRLCCRFSILLLLLPGSPVWCERDSPGLWGGMSPPAWGSGLPKVSCVGLGAILMAWVNTHPCSCMGRAVWEGSEFISAAVSPESLHPEELAPAPRSGTKFGAKRYKVPGFPLGE
ncbi:uncharacterized protein LJ206_013112 [Theristicus caerulescens]